MTKKHQHGSNVLCDMLLTTFKLGDSYKNINSVIFTFWWHNLCYYFELKVHILQTWQFDRYFHLGGKSMKMFYSLDFQNIEISELSLIVSSYTDNRVDII